MLPNFRNRCDPFECLQPEFIIIVSLQKTSLNPPVISFKYESGSTSIPSKAFYYKRAMILNRVSSWMISNFLFLFLQSRGTVENRANYANNNWNTEHFEVLFSKGPKTK